jgi:hypothetical protein
MLVDVFQLLKCIEMNTVEEQANYIWVWFYSWAHEFGRGGQNGVLNTTIFIKTLAILSIQLVTMFCLATTLCESDGILDVVVRFEDIFVAIIVCSPTKFQGCKVHLEF